MSQSHKNQSLVCGIIGLCFAGISYLILAFLSIPGFILGICSVVLYFKDKKAYQETSLGGLICGILAIVLGAIACTLMIINIANTARILASSLTAIKALLAF